jgi:hypothetical protein
VKNQRQEQYKVPKRKEELKGQMKSQKLKELMTKEPFSQEASLTRKLKKKH